VPELFEEQRSVSKAADRVLWMDRIGIDYSIVNAPGFPAAFPLIADPVKRRGYCRACNDLLAAELDGYQDRMGIVTTVDLGDLDWAIEEATRMRALGSRALTIRTEPVGGKSLGHRHFDRLWSAVVDLGMIVNVHTGLAPALFGDWGRLGLDTATSRGRGNYLRMANSQRHQAVELLLYSMMFGDVFVRHPKLTVLVAELNVFWLPNLVSQIERATHPNPIYGSWDAPLSGRDMMNKHVRVSPLPGLGDVNALDVLEELPGMVVFSSDYPHSEGNPDPIELYGDRLKSMDRDVYRKFMGATMVESFALTGDPLPGRRAPSTV
jgi:predicted TIM-barrel fold metal-dependent hydrolase